MFRSTKIFPKVCHTLQCMPKEICQRTTEPPAPFDSGRKMKIVCIEGNISAGKSTLISHLMTHFSHRSDIVFVTEPVGEFMTFQDLFEPFRCQEREPYRDSVATQIHITNVLVDHYYKVFASLTDNISLLICDRYVHAVPVFLSALQHVGYISNFSHVVLLAYGKRLLLDVLPQADFIYYLDPPLSTIEERIEWRGRDGECGFVTRQYLETLSDEYHKQLLTDDYVWKRNKSTDAADIILKDFITFINENMSCSSQQQPPTTQYKMPKAWRQWWWHQQPTFFANRRCRRFPLWWWN